MPGRPLAYRVRCPRMGAARPALALVALMVATGPSAIFAQESGTYTFRMNLGGQTMGTEVVRRSPVRVEVDLVSRLGSGRVHYVLTVAPDGRVPAMWVAMYAAAGDTAPAQSIDLRFEDDSVVATLSGRTSKTERLATEPGAMPYINPSAAMLEQLLRRARDLGSSIGQVDTVPLFAVQGGSTTPVMVTWTGADSATLAIAGVEMRACVSAGGDLESLAVPAQNLRFERVDGAHPMQPEKVDYGPPEGAPYTAEDVTVRTPAGLDLTGTLTVPDTAGGPVPAVVTITGSGAEDRDERIPLVRGYRPFWQIADTLGRRGIATLRLDDRGVNGSSPGPNSATSADYADDIRAAVAWLRKRPGIDGRRIGLVGHSEGGLIAPMVAATDSSLAGIVLMAGPASTGRRILDYQNRGSIERAPGLSPAERDSVLATVPGRLAAMAEKSAWLRFFLDYDPLPTARRVRVPVLVLQGETDHQVTPEQADTLAAAFREGGDADVTLKEFPDTDHLFLADPSGVPSAYATLPSHSVRPEVLGAIADWLAEHLK